MQRRRNGLAHVHVACHYRAVNRRANHRVVEIGLRHLERRFLLADLRFRLRHVGLRAPHCCIRGIVVGFRHVQLLLAHDSGFGKSGRAVVIALRLNQRCSGFFQICARGNEIGSGVFQVCRCLLHGPLKQRGIDQRNKIPFVHAGIKIDKKLRDRSRYLGAHLHGDDRVDRAGGLDDVVDVAALDFCGEILDRRRAV